MLKPDRMFFITINAKHFSWQGMTSPDYYCFPLSSIIQWVASNMRSSHLPPFCCATYLHVSFIPLWLVPLFRRYLKNVIIPCFSSKVDPSYRRKNDQDSLKKIVVQSRRILFPSFHSVFVFLSCSFSSIPFFSSFPFLDELLSFVEFPGIDNFFLLPKSGIKTGVCIRQGLMDNAAIVKKYQLHSV